MEHRLAALVPQPGADHPAGGHIDHAQRVQELAGAIPAAVSDQIHLEEPWPDIGPFGKRADGDLAFEQRAGPGRAEAAPHLGLLAQWLECAIHGGWTHACDTLLDRDGELA